MKIIVITGALGYIGTELCKLYSGFSWKYEVIAIDNRFISERVNELKRRKIKFIQADILDIDSIKPYLEKADKYSRSINTVQFLMNIYQTLEMDEKATKFTDLYKEMRD